LNSLNWRRALHELDLAHTAADAAHRAFLDCPLGDTDLLLERSARWHAAETRVELASRREREERAKAGGIGCAHG
jgi:hypothetical protein